jgi:type III pantothenate kinase
VQLLIDIGNTNLKWATLVSGRLGEMRAVRHHGGLPIDLHAAWEALPPPEQILVSNVGGEKIGAALRAACISRWHREPRFVQSEPTGWGVTVAYARPERLGVDRWLAMIAAHHRWAAPVLIVDAGTAVTYDLLLADGRQLGGLILPGIEMMREGLLAGTHIPRAEAEEAIVPWASDTTTAITSGPVQALAALAERLRDRLQTEARTAPELVLTGGDAERLLSALDRPARCEPSVVLQGLARIA